MLNKLPNFALQSVFSIFGRFFFFFFLGGGGGEEQCLLDAGRLLERGVYFKLYTKPGPSQAVLVTPHRFYIKNNRVIH